MACGACNPAWLIPYRPPVDIRGVEVLATASLGLVTLRPRIAFLADADAIIPVALATTATSITARVRPRAVKELTSWP